MSVHFGTDGVRGVANTELTAEIALALGRAAAVHLHGTKFLVGRDTRQSGQMLLAALGAGIASEGLEVIDIGVVPTPGLAYLAAEHHAPAAMISASHNPYYDNGIKMISSNGTKLAEPVERAIEAELTALERSTTEHLGVFDRLRSMPVGVIHAKHDEVEKYIAHLLSAVEDAYLQNLSVVVDCANGAASELAGEVFRRAGAKVTVVNASPDGTNINARCGSTHPDELAKTVVALGADLGLAFDGDADRLVAVDGNGTTVDGDALLALFAFDMKAHGTLAHDRIAITVMSNLGLRRALRDGGIDVVETPVGDRNVSDALDEGGLVLGGEQSGHIIFRSAATTGDGMLTGLKLLELIARAHRPLADLAADAMTRLPQELRSVPITDPGRLIGAEQVWREIERIESSFGDSGRVLVRASGTEPVVRIMVEAESREAATAAVDSIAAIVERELTTSNEP